MENINKLIQAWQDICDANPQLGIERTFKVRHDSKIWTCSNKVLNQVPGLKLYCKDENPDGPTEDSYEPSCLEPSDDEEREIIDKYNTMIKRKFQRAQELSDRDYQTHTMMISYTVNPVKRSHPPDSSDSESEPIEQEIESKLRKTLRKSYGFKTDVESMSLVGTSGYLYLNFSL